MATKCENCPLRRADMFIDMTSDEVRFMQRFKAGELMVEPGTPILMEGSSSPQLYTVLRGMGLRYKTLPNGKRQVINFVFAGDFLGLQAGVMKEMTHSVEASTQMTLCVFNRSELWSFFKNHSDRAYDLTWLAAVEEHFMGETVVTLGQRSAIERMAWALVRLFGRAEALGLTEGDQMPLPYRQQDLADALGLSLVHTNKTLAKLREKQLAAWSDGTLRIRDMKALAQLGMVDLENPMKRPLI